MLAAGDLTTGHKVVLIVAAAIFIVFAVGSSFLVPRYRPDFPGPAGLSVFVIASIALFLMMVLAINFFG